MPIIQHLLLLFLQLALAMGQVPTMQASLSVFNKMPVIIEQQFSETSDITLVVTSCGRLNLLEVTLNSFFHWNTYVLREVILVEDCGVDRELLWGMLPAQARKYQGKFFTVLTTNINQTTHQNNNATGNNNKRKGFVGQIPAIDIAYSHVKSKYVFYLEGDWLQLGSYGFLQRLKDVLQDCERIGIKASQGILTFPDWNWSHMPSPQQSTPHGTKYHSLTSYGKQYLYSFSFNPHLLNFNKIYKQILNGSYMQSIARRFHCVNGGGEGQGKEEGQGEPVMENGGCVQYQTGKYLTQIGFRQVWVKIRKEPVYQHIGEQGWVGQAVLNFQQQETNQDLGSAMQKSENIEKQVKPNSSEQSVGATETNPPLPLTTTTTAIEQEKYSSASTPTQTALPPPTPITINSEITTFAVEMGQLVIVVVLCIALGMLLWRRKCAANVVQFQLVDSKTIKSDFQLEEEQAQFNP